VSASADTKKIARRLIEQEFPNVVGRLVLRRFHYTYYAVGTDGKASVVVNEHPVARVPDCRVWTLLGSLVDLYSLEG
jgi:hypothetical protein